MTDAAADKPDLPSVDIQQLMELLPHRAPMLLIEKMIDIVPNISATGVKAVSMNEPFFVGHFPGHPIMPGVMIIEAMAQTAGALVMHSQATTAEDKIVYFMSVERARFRQPVFPGSLLHLPVKLLKARAPVWRFSGEAYVSGKLCAEAEFTAMIAKKN
jgi:3-hydroxyacyl-[acyl-carrier-protein] dehydratase